MDSAVTLQKIRYFISVAETGSVSDAAKIHHVSASSVSEAVKLIEAEAGKMLFARKRAGMIATETCIRMCRNFRDILTQLDQVMFSATDADLVSGTLNLAVSPTVSDMFLVSLLRDMQIRFPLVNVSLTEIDNTRYGEMVKETFDLLLLITSNYEQPPGYSKTVLGLFPRQLWVSEQHPLAVKKEVFISDINNQNYIQCTMDNLEFFIHKLFKPKTIFRTLSTEATRSMVAANKGITIMPDIDYMSYSPFGERIVRRRIENEDLFMELGVLQKTDVPLSDAASAVLRFFTLRKW